LAEPISIIDKDKFKEEYASPATKELKMRNNLKHVIKVGLDKKSRFLQTTGAKVG
jgi:type I restriction enzyme R subunit